MIYRALLLLAIPLSWLVMVPVLALPSQDSQLLSSPVSNRHNLPSYLQVLRNAHTLDDAAIGFAAARSQTYQAFEQALKAGSSIRSELDELLQQGSGSGRIYAAILIERLDKEAGRTALSLLQTDPEVVEHRSGCLTTNHTVGELATNLLRGQTVVFVPADSTLSQQ
ncbi:MAG: hypothetical protein KME08_19790 [Aphanothece sp. CMT-3BRIN-NPC111]|jgi:hypothetical protein|nr:hypothetical protein [Aphanothece sp. CMT-3BRIN-NPC111]